jgi:hypothetical protein
MGETETERRSRATSRRLYGVFRVGLRPRVSGVLRSRCLCFLARFLPSSLSHHLAVVVLDALSSSNVFAASDALPIPSPPPTPLSPRCRCRRRRHLRHPRHLQCLFPPIPTPSPLDLHSTPRLVRCLYIRYVTTASRIIYAPHTPSPPHARSLHTLCALTMSCTSPPSLMHPHCHSRALICTPHRLVFLARPPALYTPSFLSPPILSTSPMDPRSRRFLTRRDHDDDNEDKDDVTTTARQRCKHDTTRIVKTILRARKRRAR